MTSYVCHFENNKSDPNANHINKEICVNYTGVKKNGSQFGEIIVDLPKKIPTYNIHLPICISI